MMSNTAYDEYRTISSTSTFQQGRIQMEDHYFYVINMLSNGVIQYPLGFVRIVHVKFPTFRADGRVFEMVDSLVAMARDRHRSDAGGSRTCRLLRRLRNRRQQNLRTPPETESCTTSTPVFALAQAIRAALCAISSAAAHFSTSDGAALCRRRKLATN